MSIAWYTYSDGVRLGPMSWDEVRAAARDGSLKPEDAVLQLMTRGLRME